MGRFEIFIGAQFGGCLIKLAVTVLIVKRPPLVPAHKLLSRKTYPGGPFLCRRRQQMTKSGQDDPRGIILLILSFKIAVEHLRLVWAFSAELLLDYPKLLADGRSDSRIWNRTLRPDTKANSTFGFSSNARYYSQKVHSELAKRTIRVPKTAKTY